MEKARAQVRGLQIRERQTILPVQQEGESNVSHIQWRKSVKMRFSERLSRNMAIASALVIGAAALHAIQEEPTAQAVFDTVQNQMEWELDDSLGRLSFVSNLLPEASMVFWNGATDIEVMAPLEGDIHHVWTAGEPYISMKGSTGNVHCGAAGEVMAVAHGDNEELVVRIRHDDCWETLYGNLVQCSVAVGDQVSAGQCLGQVEGPVYFELRQNGRAIDPTYIMQTYEDAHE